MNHLMLSDPETNSPAWSLIVLEPEELIAVANGNPAMIDLDPESDNLPMLTIACEESSDRLTEILDTGDAEAILAYLRNEAPKFADTIKGRRREDYERAARQTPARQRMLQESVVMSNSLNIAAACDEGDQIPDRISINLSVPKLEADVCFELKNMVQADQLIELLIGLRNRLWPHGRVAK